MVRYNYTEILVFVAEVEISASDSDPNRKNNERTTLKSIPNIPNSIFLSGKYNMFSNIFLWDIFPKLKTDLILDCYFLSKHLPLAYEFFKCFKKVFAYILFPYFSIHRVKFFVSFNTTSML